MRTRFAKLAPGFVAAAIALAALPVSANTITPTHTSVIGVGPYTWNYDASLDSGIVQGGNANGPQFFTIYDIDGYVLNSAVAPAGWSVSQQLLGLTGFGTAPVDSAAYYNVTWTYTGAFINDAPGGGTTTWTGFSFVSTAPLSVANASFWTSQDVKNSNDSLQGAIGTLTGPSAVPEPGSMFLLGSGLLGLAGAVRRRIRK